MTTLDPRQSQLVKQLAKEVTDDIETRPFDVAADRIEALFLMLEMIGEGEAAAAAQHLVGLLRESKRSHVGLRERLSKLLTIDAQPAAPTPGKP